MITAPAIHRGARRRPIPILSVTWAAQPKSLTPHQHRTQLATIRRLLCGQVRAVQA